MIIPQIESDLTMNVIVVGADIIWILKKNREYMIVEDLLKHFLKQDKRRTHNLFFDTLTFLYALEMIKEKDFKVTLKYGYTQKNLL